MPHVDVTIGLFPLFLDSRTFRSSRDNLMKWTASRFPYGVTSLFGFTAIALGLVGYITTLFKLSADDHLGMDAAR